MWYDVRKSPGKTNFAIEVTNVEQVIIHSDPDILSGIPVFVGTRVPAKTLIDYLEGGHNIDDFLDDFPTVSRTQANAFLKQAFNSLLIQVYASAA